MGKDRGLYRGKRIDTDDWIYGFYAKSGDKEYINKDHDTAFGYVTMKEVVPETVCEATGLYTADGTEIYENDICRFDDRNFIVTYLNCYDKKWTTEEIVEECKNVIDQIVTKYYNEVKQ